MGEEESLEVRGARQMAKIGATGLMAVWAVSWALALWAIALLAYQGIGWLQHAVWQPIDLGAIWLNPIGQAELKMYPNNPLDLVPTWGSYGTIEGNAYSFFPGALGAQKVVLWILTLPLVAVLSFLSAWGFIWAFQADTELRDYKRVMGV